MDEYEWHMVQVEWRIAIVTRLEQLIEGCHDHAVGTAVLR